MQVTLRGLVWCRRAELSKTLPNDQSPSPCMEQCWTVSVPDIFFCTEHSPKELCTCGHDPCFVSMIGCFFGSAGERTCAAMMYFPPAFTAARQPGTAHSDPLHCQHSSVGGRYASLRMHTCCSKARLPTETNNRMGARQWPLKDQRHLGPPHPTARIGCKIRNMKYLSRTFWYFRVLSC